MQNPSTTTMRWWIMIGLLVVTFGCLRQYPKEVVVYVALDSEFSEPILKRFTEETGIRVRAKFDVESTKTVGLTNAIIAEAGKPRCDLFWNNEILNTLRLEQRGLLAAYPSTEQDRFPPSTYSRRNTWHGFAARARVLIVNTEQLANAADRPASVLALADKRWAGRVAMAKPLFGTTASHATILFDVLGEATAKEFFRNAAATADVLSGNRQVANAVARGQYAWGLTDTDDAIIEIQQGRPVEIVYPDQAEGQFGTLYIPNTVAIVANSPQIENAKRLVDFLLTAQVESELAACPSAQVPLGQGAESSGRILQPPEIRAMQADFSRAAKSWEVASPFLRDLFMQAGDGS